MSPKVPAELLDRAAARFEREAQTRARETPKKTPRVIAISRDLGAGGRSVAEILAETLKWPLWDREILDVMANRSSLRYQARMFDSLDETTQGGIDAALYAMLGGTHKDVYFYLLPKAILTVAQNDAVILGRGAHLLLPNALKVMLTASLETRTRRMAEREGLTEAQSLARVKASDRERCAFLREFGDRLAFGHGGRRPQEAFDLTIDTDAFTLQQAASVILHSAALRFGPSNLAEVHLPAGPLHVTA